MTDHKTRVVGVIIQAVQSVATIGVLGVVLAMSFGAGKVVEKVETQTASLIETRSEVSQIAQAVGQMAIAMQAGQSTQEHTRETIADLRRRIERLEHKDRMETRP